MSASRRDTLVRFERFAGERDDYGQEIKTWAEIGREYAQVSPGRGDERRAAAREDGEQVATFRVLSNPLTRSITIRDRIVSDDANWNIVNIAPIARSEIAFTAKRGLS